jgi:hypothetical protein
MQTSAVSEGLRRPWAPQARQLTVLKRDLEFLLLRLVSQIRNIILKQEDAQLLMLVDEFGLQQWHLIASKLEGRSLRQCCERYTRYIE